MSANTLSHFTFSDSDSMYDDNLIFTIDETQLGSTLHNEEFGIYIQSGSDGSYVTVNYSLTGDFEDTTNHILQGESTYLLPYNIVQHIKNKATDETNHLVHFGIEVAYSGE